MNKTENNAMLMNWKNYEELTKHIYETLGGQFGVKIVGAGNSCKVKGKSGVEHQIDVLTSHSDGIHQYKTAIECKYWNEKITKDTVMKVLSIIEDTNIDKGVIVSKKGFTHDALTFAQYQGIGLVELREMTSEDWKGRLRNINVCMQFFLPEISKADFVLEQEVTPNIKNNAQTPPELLQIRKNNDEIIEFEAYINDSQSEIQKKSKNGELVKKTYEFEPDTQLIYVPTLEMTPILGLEFEGFLKVIERNFEIKGDNYISMIMKNIFEDVEYTIAKDGKIKKREKLQNERTKI